MPAKINGLQGIRWPICVKKNSTIQRKRQKSITHNRGGGKMRAKQVRRIRLGIDDMAGVSPADLHPRDICKVYVWAWSEPSRIGLTLRWRREAGMDGARLVGYVAVRLPISQWQGHGRELDLAVMQTAKRVLDRMARHSPEEYII
jgi:hypothetical protein